MATKRKYINFICFCPGNNIYDGEDFFEHDSWKAVFAAYMKQESGTIYGLPVNWKTNPRGNYEVIMTKC